MSWIFFTGNKDKGNKSEINMSINTAVFNWNIYANKLFTVAPNASRKTVRVLLTGGLGVSVRTEQCVEFDDELNWIKSGKCKRVQRHEHGR